MYLGVYVYGESWMYKGSEIKEGFLDEVNPEPGLKGAV